MQEENRVEFHLEYTSFIYGSRPGNERSAQQRSNHVFYNGMPFSFLTFILK
jgi:hypothetical protein